MEIRSFLPAGAFALVWVSAAALNPTTTYHLAPIIVAVIPALRFPAMVRQLTASVGAVLASGVSVALWITGNLGGPSLLPVGGPLLESVAGAVLGGSLGLFVAGRLDPTVSASRQ